MLRDHHLLDTVEARQVEQPRAPVLRSIALRATALNASSAKVRSTPSISNSSWYCFTRAFFGSVRMRLRDASSRSPSVATTGSRPTNSGISPYFNRSSGSTSRKKVSGRDEEHQGQVPSRQSQKHRQQGSR